MYVRVGPPRQSRTMNTNGFRHKTSDGFRTDFTNAAARKKNAPSILIITSVYSASVPLNDATDHDGEVKLL